MTESRFTRVRYLRVSRISLEIVQGLSEHEKAMFLDQCLAWFQQLEQGKEINIAETESILLNLALREEISELQGGFNKYMQSVNAPKKETENADTSPIKPTVNADITPMHLTEQTKSKEKHIQNIEQTKSDLSRYGCSADEISMAIDSVKDWTGIQNPTAYLLQIIKNQRQKPKKILPAQNFPQRDYSDVNKQVIDDLAREMAEFKAKTEGA